MCGICGGLSWKRPLDERVLRRMAGTMVHRGPDDEGYHVAPPAALATRRLAIIDLETGRQPLANEDGSVWAVLNGEIYNYLELRAELESRGHRFRTKGDTEVLVHLYEEHGEEFPAKLAGMFAVALWDARAEKLLLVRDRLGKKPLYWARTADGLVFGSELKALLASGLVSRELDAAALGEYLAKLYIGGEATIYREVRQLRPARLLAAGRGGLAERAWWDPWSIPARSGPFREPALVEELGALLAEAVRLRLRSDVPLGCFLSGGIDSSLVAALACRHSGGLRTFTVGFDGAGYDEAPEARRFAERLGAEHREYRVPGGPDEETLARLLDFFDQPFGDSSAVPAWHLARMTRQAVTVALSGDGGDEVFGGYPRYLARRWAAGFNRLPRPARRAAAALAGLLGERGDRYGGGAGGKLRRFAAYAEQVRRRPAATRLDYFPSEAQAALLVPEVFEQVARAAAAETGPAPEGFDPVDWAQRRDLTDYLPDDILVKVDRTSMAASLEARAPLLDHRIVEFMLALPADWKLRGRTGKYLLRRFARTLLPAEVLRRKKHGFAIALGGWFRAGGAGRSRLEALAGGALGRLVRRQAVEELLARHDSGRRDLGEHLWALLVLGLWVERQPRNPV